MSGSQRLMEAFFNWGLNLSTNPEDFDHLEEENKHLNMLRQLSLCIDPSYFQSLPKTTFSIKEMEHRLCQYSLEVLGINKQPLLAQDYLGKVTPLKIIIVFKLVFRIINERGLELKIHKLQEDDRKLLEHFIRSLNLKEEQIRVSTNEIDRTIKKSQEKNRLREQNEALRKQLAKCYEREKSIKADNTRLEAEVKSYQEDKRSTEILFHQFKQRIEMLEEVMVELSSHYQQDPIYRTEECIPSSQDGSHSVKTPATIYYTPINHYPQDERSRAESNVSNSTTAEVARCRYKKLKLLHKDFQETMKHLMER